MWKPCENDKIYSVDNSDIVEAETMMGFSLPSELKKFYETFGYGFISDNKTNINRILDPLSVSDLRLKTNEYEFYVDLDLYDEFGEDKLLFFEANEGVLFSIEITESMKQKIYFYGEIIADSLAEFLEKYSKDNHYYEKMK